MRKQSCEFISTTFLKDLTAKLTEWKATFDVVYNEQLIADPQIIHTVLKEAGERIGIFDFRPQKGGPYGTFCITKFEEVK